MHDIVEVIICVDSNGIAGQLQKSVCCIKYNTMFYFKSIEEGEETLQNNTMYFHHHARHKQVLVLHRGFWPQPETVWTSRRS
mgnify:FL=1